MFVICSSVVSWLSIIRKCSHSVVTLHISFYSEGWWETKATNHMDSCWTKKSTPAQDGSVDCLSRPCSYLILLMLPRNSCNMYCIWWWSSAFIWNGHMMKLPLDFSKPAKDSAFTCTVVYVQHSVLSCVVHEMLLRFSRKSYISMKTLMLQLLNLFILSFMKHSTFYVFSVCG